MVSESEVQVDRRYFAKALELLGPNGEYWVRGIATGNKSLVDFATGAPEKDVPCFCLEGAVACAVTGDAHVMYSVSSSMRFGISKESKKYKPYWDLMWETLGCSPMNWNDDKERKFADVKELLTRLAFPTQFPGPPSQALVNKNPHGEVLWRGGAGHPGTRGGWGFKCSYCNEGARRRSARTRVQAETEFAVHLTEKHPLQLKAGT